jgi:hypothetical protein
MSCARAANRDIRKWLALSSVVVSLGCMSVVNVPPPDPSNPLPKDVKPTEADFLAQIAPYKPVGTGHPHDRPADGCFLGWCPKKTTVNIVALGDTYEIDPEAPPTVGRPVAHLANLGDKVEKYYGLLPQSQADYYLWVDAKSATRAQWTLLELSHVTHTVTAAKPTDLNYCHKYDTKKVSDADFAEFKHKTCDWQIPDAAAKVSQASLIPTAFSAVLHNVLAFLSAASTGGGWIACSNGCCT